MQLNKYHGIIKTSTTIFFALWWGGFTLYSYWVIPIAHTVTGDKILTGLITQKVSMIFNMLAACFILSATFYFFADKDTKPILPLQKLTLLWLAICLVVLIILHPIMDKFLPYQVSNTEIRITFYHYHRVYLMTSTLMWIGGLLWLISYRKSIL